MVNRTTLFFGPSSAWRGDITRQQVLRPDYPHGDGWWRRKRLMTEKGINEGKTSVLFYIVYPTQSYCNARLLMTGRLKSCRLPETKSFQRLWRAIKPFYWKSIKFFVMLKIDCIWNLFVVKGRLKKTIIERCVCSYRFLSFGDDIFRIFWCRKSTNLPKPISALWNRSSCFQAAEHQKLAKALEWFGHKGVDRLECFQFNVLNSSVFWLK